MSATEAFVVDKSGGIWVLPAGSGAMRPTGGATAAALQASNNLSDVASSAAARHNLFAPRVFSPYSYGGVGNGIADDTTPCASAITAAAAVGGTVDFGGGTWLTSAPLPILSGVTYKGDGPDGGGIINNVSSAVFSLSSTEAYQWVMDGLVINASGGHVFACATGSYSSRGTILRTWATQNSNSFGIWNQPNGDYVDMLVGDNCYFQAQQYATVIPWLIKSNSAISSNTWRRMRVSFLINTTLPFFYLEDFSTSAGYIAGDNTFREITCEQCAGGMIQGMSVQNLTIDNVVEYDAQLQQSGFVIGTSATGGVPSSGIRVLGSGRRVSTISAGKYDVQCSSDTTNILIENCDPTDEASTPFIYSGPVAQTTILTNSTIQGRRKQRVSTLAAVSNVYTPNADGTDIALITTPAANFTIANPTGTPNDGDNLAIRIASGTAFTPSFGMAYSPGTSTPLPTLVTASATDYLLFQWNAAESKWNLIGYSPGL